MQARTERWFIYMFCRFSSGGDGATPSPPQSVGCVRLQRANEDTSMAPMWRVRWDARARWQQWSDRGTPVRRAHRRESPAAAAYISPTYQQPLPSTMSPLIKTQRDSVPASPVDDEPFELQFPDVR